MKTFKNLKTGVLEHVTNEKLISQYEKYTDVYEEIKEKKNDKPKADKPATNKDADKPAE